MQGNNFNTIYSENILAALRPGENVVSAIVENVGDAPNPAGFIAAIQLTRADSSALQIVSDQTWKASPDGHRWSASQVLGGGHMSPWNIGGKKDGDSTELYPPYHVASALLKQMGKAEIFSSDGSLRFHQRRTDDRDIFFVANREARLSSCTGVFRTDGTNPELWDPIHGSVKALPSFSEQKNGTVRVPLQFAAHEGYFIVFDRKAKVEKGEGANFASLKPVQTINGAWQVAFDPVWGGPDTPVTFAQLTDWTTHDRPGIKYYSGIAVYKTRFDSIPAELDSKTLLDLGNVKDMARVTLNGKTLGTVWSEPYRMTIPAGLLKKANNQLKIEVVNTWHNRLVGDKQPKDRNARKLQWKSGLLGGKTYPAGRYTFSTGSDVRPNASLLPSGLLGPVRIMTSGNK